ncbi:MAG: hypothetical protein ACOH2D_11780 [Gelidibacter sp.]
MSNVDLSDIQKYIKSESEFATMLNCKLNALETILESNFPKVFDAYQKALFEELHSELPQIASKLNYDPL